MPESGTDNRSNVHLVSNLHDSNKSISSSHDDFNGSEDPATESKNTDKNLSSGSVSIVVYQSFLTAGGSVFKVFLVLFGFIFTQVLITGGDYWISFWYCT